MCLELQLIYYNLKYVHRNDSYKSHKLPKAYQIENRQKYVVK